MPKGQYVYFYPDTLLPAGLVRKLFMVQYSTMKLYDTIRRDALLYVVFGTGAVILAVEVLAVRVLSPYFGNTMYSFSSILSVMLAGLSLGYWRGGRLADASPNTRSFYLHVAKAGFSVVVVQFLSYIVLPLLAVFLSLRSGPLVASLVLFFVPGYLFGLLSPYVIKLRSVAHPERGVGTVSGEVYFASTLGSIVGSLMSGFVLVPSFGVSLSMFLLGGVVLAVGLIGAHVARTTQALAAIAVVLLCTAALRVSPAHPAGGTVLHAEDGIYERITVFEGPAFGTYGRMLMLDRTYSSGVALPDGDLLFPYTRYYRLYRGYAPELRRALVLGAGTGTVAKELHEDYPDATVDIVDIEPRLFSLAHEYFFMPQTERIRTHTMDGRQFLRKSGEQYDMIFGDMYATVYSIPWHVATVEYYALLRERLAPGGVYIGNYIGSLDPSAPSLIWSSVHSLREVFDEVDVYAVDTPVEGAVQNIMLVARKDAPLGDVSAEPEDAELRHMLDTRYAYDSGALEAHAVFTDDKAPVEQYSARLMP